MGNYNIQKNYPTKVPITKIYFNLVRLIYVLDPKN